MSSCTWFLHLADSACNLATLNRLAFLDGGEFDLEAFTAAVELLVLAQDAIVDGLGYPSEQIQRNARRLRQIGIGYANLAALLLTLAIPYDSDESRGWAAAITALMTGIAYRRSAELAARLGPFAEFQRNREPTLRVIERAARRTGAGQNRGRGAPPPARVPQRWRGEALKPRGPQRTRRPRPRDRDDRGTQRVRARPRPRCRRAGTPSPRAPRIPDGDRRNPRSPLAHLRMVAAMQPFLSGGVSKTVPLPAEAGLEAVEEIFVSAWRLGLKSIAIYREGSKLGQPLTADRD